MLTDHKEQLAKAKKVLVDGGYSGEVFANQVKKVLQGAEVKVAKRI